MRVGVAKVVNNAVGAARRSSQSILNPFAGRQSGWRRGSALGLPVVPPNAPGILGADNSVLRFRGEESQAAEVTQPPCNRSGRHIMRYTL